MYIRSIRLLDWKAYTDVKFDFPAPRAGKNVILIGAKNGYGKTSLLEAILLGLFGRDGLPLVGRASMGNAEDNRLDYSYNTFLEKAFHAHAREHGRSSMTVELSFITDTDEPISVQRIWYFTGSGKHRAAEEEVRIWRGPDDEIVTVPPLEERDEFYRGYIAQHFLPHHLAQFFLFDGEQVQRLARQDMSSQVQIGIEGILGVPVLRELAGDLRKYASDRRRSAGAVADEKINRLRAEIVDLENEEETCQSELRGIEPKIGPLRDQRDQFVRTISALRGGDYASLKQLFEDKERYQRNLDRHIDELRRLLSVNAALAVAGKPLRDRTTRRLKAEAIRERWEAGKKQGEDSFEKFINCFHEAHPVLNPELTSEQKSALNERLHNAWQNIWYPPPNDCAEGYRHSHLDDATRVQAIAKLEEVDKLAINSIMDIIRDIGEKERELKKIDARIASQRGIDDDMRKFGEDQDRVVGELKDLEHRQRELLRRLEGLRGQLNPKRQELGKMEESLNTAERPLRRSGKADRVADLIDSIIAEAFPSHIDNVADAMTKAYCTMAHKNVVERIQVDPDCKVRLLSNSGRDLREMDPAAGESQIFALSLIAAIGEVSQRKFPIVMDTPLARLDSDHRRNVLKFFTDMDCQIVLLSQPDEVHGEYFDLIQHKLQSVVHLEYEVISDGVGRSILKDGYFGTTGDV